MSNPERYTVGWICAIPTEYTAAQALLDERHEGPEAVSRHDNNDYTLGRIGKHAVVVAVLPDGEYGTSSAASVARDMLHSFPNIRIGLMVGIGGGAPSPKNDIRLGDVVVSAPRGGRGGVLQYDFGKTIQDQEFRPTGFLGQPPTVLRTAVSGLKTQYELDGHKLSEDIDRMLADKPRLQKKYRRPDVDSDRLYQSAVTHPQGDEGACTKVCSSDASQLVPRPRRTEEEDNPAIHHGLVASADKLMKDASMRDKLAAEHGILCFEMEAAGLMNHFPCLIIRGICDYSDTHKNKEWQGYAAMAAAAYAKDLLCRIAPNRIEAEKRLSEVLSEGLSDLQEVTKEHLGVAEKQLGLTQKHVTMQENKIKQKLSDQQKQCHQLFRLAESSKDTTYEWYKDRVEDRVDGTCTWFLRHSHFQEWLSQDSGLLLVSADPGCGKSVLAKYLIDHALPRSATICYFFFKDQDQHTVRQALCALLHQLFTQKPVLVQHAMKQFDENGAELVNSTSSLWTILRDAVHDAQAGPVIIVLDALDECAESEVEDLVRNVESQTRSSQSSHGRLRYLLTSRPYHQIVSKFQRLLAKFPDIWIPGEEESEAIGQEVSLVVEDRVERLARDRMLPEKLKVFLTNQLLSFTHRTYLWVYLVFDQLKAEVLKKTENGIKLAVTTLPKDIYHAYEQILNKSADQVLVRKVLAVILAARRPLTLSEMNVAVNVDDTTQSLGGLDLEEEEDFKLRLRSCCGLFVSIYRNKIYLLHQTAREFLLAGLPTSTTVPTGLQWHHSITSQHAHTMLAELCVRFLVFFDYDSTLIRNNTEEAGGHVERFPFLEFSAKFWAEHFHQASIGDGDAVMLGLASRVSSPNSKCYSVWSKIYWTEYNNPRFDASLAVGSFFGHVAVVKLLLDKGADVNAQGGDYGNALQAASQGGHEAVVKLLLDRGADVNAQGGYYGNALQAASEGGHEAVVKLLLDRGADVNAQGGIYSNALQAASEGGHEAVVRTLLAKDSVDVNCVDNRGRTPHVLAQEEGHDAVCRLLRSSC